MRAARLGQKTLKGIRDPVSCFNLQWLDPELFPDQVHIEQTGQEIPLNLQTRVRFGRLATFQGERANEVVLRHPDSERTRYISRWHFELLRQVDGYVLKQLSRIPVTVDGEQVDQGQTAPITPTSIIQIADVLTLRLGRVAHTRDAETQGPWEG